MTKYPRPPIGSYHSKQVPHARPWTLSCEHLCRHFTRSGHSHTQPRMSTEPDCFQLRAVTLTPVCRFPPSEALVAWGCLVAGWATQRLCGKLVIESIIMRAPIRPDGPRFGHASGKKRGIFYSRSARGDRGNPSAIGVTARVL